MSNSMSFSMLVKRANDALRTNPPTADKSLTSGASKWLWAVFALFLVTFLAFLLWSFVLKAPGHTSTSHRRPTLTGASKDGAATTDDTTTTTTPGATALGTSTAYGHAGHAGHASASGPSAERVFHYLWTVAAFAGMVAYFTMASDLGNTPIRQYLRHGGNPFQTRQVFYARYIYWFVAWPLVVTATLLVSGTGWATLLFGIAMQELWIVCWLCGALVRTKYKWGFYVFGILAYCVLATVLLHWGRRRSLGFGPTTKQCTPLAGALVGFWLIYWIAWGLAEGGNYLTITGEMIFYGILDLITVPLIGFAFLSMSGKWDHSALGLHFSESRVGHGYGGGASGSGHGHHHNHELGGTHGRHVSEKDELEAGAAGAGLGAGTAAAATHHHHGVEHGHGHGHGIGSHHENTIPTAAPATHGHPGHHEAVPSTTTTTTTLGDNHQHHHNTTGTTHVGV